MAELKACPFCGGEAGQSIGKTADGCDWVYIECEDCGAMGADITHWNRRTTDALAKQLAEALKLAEETGYMDGEPTREHEEQLQIDAALAAAAEAGLLPEVKA